MSTKSLRYSVWMIMLLVGMTGCCIFSNKAVAQSIQFLKDINSQATALGSNPAGFVFCNGISYFKAEDAQSGEELWRTDGTSGGTWRVADINPGLGGSQIYGLSNQSVIGNIFYFAANDGAHGWELWRSDGTLPGTYMVRDIHPQQIDPQYRELTVFMGKLYFVVDDGVHDRELWRSDGTRSGTVLYLDTDPNNTSLGPSQLLAAANRLYFVTSVQANFSELWRTDGQPQDAHILKSLLFGNIGAPEASMAVVGDNLYFAASDMTHGSELWVSDGTAAGTVLLKDIRAGSGNSSPQNLVYAGGKIYFTADDGAHGRELWRTTGSASATMLINDMTPGSAATAFFNFTSMNGELYFSANGISSGIELWKSNGTLAGTVMVADVNTGTGSSFPQSFAVLNNMLFFSAVTTGGNRQLWKSDGTAGGTANVSQSAATDNNANFGAEIFSTGNHLLFSVNDGTHGHELWRSNGYAINTYLVKDIRGGTGDIHVAETANVNGVLFMTVKTDKNSSSAGLWRTDGTPAGTYAIFNIGQNLQFRSLTAVSDWLYFVYDDGAHGYELWRCGRTSTTPTLVRDIYPGSGSGVLSGPFVSFGSKIYFLANDGVHGNELWRSDGTDAGTAMLEDLKPGSGSGLVDGRSIVLNNALYFTGDNGSGSTGLWRSNGQTGGAVLVKAIPPGANGLVLNEFIKVDQSIFLISAEINKKSIYKSDGTTAGTMAVQTITGNSGALFTWNPLVSAGKLFFGQKTFTSALVNEWWVTDGSTAGTGPVHQPASALAGEVSLYAAAMGKLFFRGDGGLPHGLELFVSAGAPGDGRLLTDIEPGPRSSLPDSLTAMDDGIMFTAAETSFGRELWHSDATGPGTRRVLDIYPGSTGSINDGETGRLLGLNGRVFFGAHNGVIGNELWSSDGAPASSFPVADVQAGPESSNPTPLAVAGNHLIFLASDPIHGRELWSADASPPVTPVLADEPEWSNGLSNTLQWTSADGNTSFTLECAENEQFSPVLQEFHFAGAQRAWTVNGLLDGHRYWYRLRGVNLLGFSSSWSNVVSSLQDALPPHSQILGATAPLGSYLITLNWVFGDTASGVEKVELFYNFNGGAPKLFGVFQNGATTYDFDAGWRERDGIYGFYSRATDRAGNVEPMLFPDFRIAVPYRLTGVEAWTEYGK